MVNRDDVIPVYLTFEQAFKFCCYLYAVCESFDDEDDAKLLLMDIFDKIREAADINLEDFLSVQDS